MCVDFTVKRLFMRNCCGPQTRGSLVVTHILPQMRSASVYLKTLSTDFSEFFDTYMFVDIVGFDRDMKPLGFPSMIIWCVLMHGEEFLPSVCWESFMFLCWAKCLLEIKAGKRNQFKWLHFAGFVLQYWIWYAMR